jgi:hypothetical protein
VLHEGMLMQKAIGLRHQAVVEARIRVHQYLQKDHRKRGTADFPTASALPRPEHAIEAVAKHVRLQCLKTVLAVARLAGVEVQRFGRGG